MKLFEINMSTNKLMQLANKMQAIAGMEFEMIVTDISLNGDSEEGEMDLNYDADEPINYRDPVQHINRFFTNQQADDPLSRREMELILRKLYENYRDWVNEQFDEYADENFPEWFTEHYTDDNWDDFFQTEKENDPTRSDDEIQSEFDDLIQYMLNKGYKDNDYLAYYHLYRDDNEEEFYNEHTLYKFLISQDIRSMMNFADTYEISWPYYDYNSPGSDDQAELERIASNFSNAVSFRVNVNTEYHGEKKSLFAYTIEPDSSLHPDYDVDDGTLYHHGLEFVSPPMPLNDLLDELNSVVEWATDNNYYTNESCGLHINVSLPGYSRDNLDYLKMAVLIGDEYILNQFGRIHNNYTSSALKLLKMQSAEKVANLFDNMKKQFDIAASRAFVSPYDISKYTSINPHENRIELRSPGGNWIDIYKTKPDLIINSLLRAIVILDAALDPTKYREEYLTKLYKLLDHTGQTSSITRLFVNYSNGLISKEQLKQEWANKELENNKNHYTVYNRKTGDVIYAARGTQPEVLNQAATRFKFNPNDLLIVPYDTPVNSTILQSRPNDTESNRRLNLASRIGKKDTT